MTKKPADASLNEEEKALEAQQMLVEDSLELVCSSYAESIEKGMAQPIIVLLDCEDELGSEIARSWLGHDAVENGIAIQKQTNDDESQTTVFAQAVAWKECREELSEAFPYLSEVLATGPTDQGILVIGITAGGASALTAPFEA